jgi:hypothetical protein
MGSRGGRERDRRGRQAGKCGADRLHRSYPGKLAAERAANDIAADVVSALELCSTVPVSVQAAVHEGHVTLTVR